MQTLDLMARLHALDAALAACQRQAIAVDELCRVWESHLPAFEDVPGSDVEWVDALLGRIAARHGILGRVRPPAGPGAPST